MSKGSDRQLWKYVTFASLFNEFYRHLPPSAAKYAFTRTQNSKLYSKLCQTLKMERFTKIVND